LPALAAYFLNLRTAPEARGLVTHKVVKRALEGFALVRAQVVEFVGYISGCR
jgi:hypothetical protein